MTLDGLRRFRSVPSINLTTPPGVNRTYTEIYPCSMTSTPGGVPGSTVIW